MKKRTKIILAAVAALALIAAMILAYIHFVPKTQEGLKTVTIEVIDKQGNTTTYEVKTNGEYLIDAMKDAKASGFTYDGENGEYGFTIYSINGLKADFNADSAYWGFYINDEYANFGVSEQPIADGDKITFRYIIYK